MKGPITRLLLVAGLAAAIPLACTGSGGPVSDAEVSLRPEGVREVTRPMAPSFAQPEPGDSQPFDRAFYGAPPMIPHVIYEGGISASGNECLDCHGYPDEDTPGIPPSHHVKAQFAQLPRERAVHGMTTAFDGFAKAEIVAGNRYDCLLCHAPQATNAEPLVGNAFQPRQPGDAADDALGGLETVGDF